MSLALDPVLPGDRRPIEARSHWQDALRRLVRNKAALASLFILAMVTVLAIFAPFFSPHPFEEIYWNRIQSPPDFANAHWFGTDGNGRDLFARTLHGGRVSLMVGFLATGVSLLIGVAYGATAGFSAGKSTI